MFNQSLKAFDGWLARQQLRAAPDAADCILIVPEQVNVFASFFKSAT